MRLPLLICCVWIVAATFAQPPAGNAPAPPCERMAAIALAFDDGFANWVEVVAPELQRVGGRATAFVNNQYIPGRIGVGDLQRLRDEFGWEIGTHGFQHVNARAIVRSQGLQAWEDRQLVAAIRGLMDHGLTPRVLAFPYNDSDAALRAVALRHVRSFRTSAPLALVRELPPDGSHPATSIDIAGYVPAEFLATWVRTADRSRATLFLNAHRVLPDAAFVRGTLRAVAGLTRYLLAPQVVPDQERTTWTQISVFHALSSDGLRTSAEPR